MRAASALRQASHGAKDIAPNGSDAATAAAVSVAAVRKGSAASGLSATAVAAYPGTDCRNVVMAPRNPAVAAVSDASRDATSRSS
ncbi:hypothetical protein RL72_01165 [Microbacterium azadirachtae]|uniref:Uncharacterized protein n=1 Tax=Microbacterium azadirachtae TaxID=582680 RepID=A0A0F0L369_9MICO|nr:hypothetical protein RL72_01165 [Microbacterium azadirachtae]